MMINLDDRIKDGMVKYILIPQKHICGGEFEVILFSV